MTIPSPKSTAPETPLEFRKYLRVLWKFKWVFLVVFCAVAAGIAYNGLRKPKVFAAITTVQIGISTPRVLEVREVVDLGTGSRWLNREFFQTQIQVITSRAVAERVARREGLGRDPDFLGLKTLKDPKLLAEATKSADAAGLLRGRVSVQRIEGSHHAQIRVEDFNRERAVKLSIAVAEAYRDINLEMKSKATKRALESLRKQKAQLLEKLEKSEAELVEFKRKHRILTISRADQQRVLSQDLLTFSKGLSLLEAKAQELRAQLKEARRPAKVEVELAEQEEVLKDRALADLRQRLGVVEQDLIGLRQRYGEKHPRRKEVEARALLFKRAIAARTKRAKARVRSRFRNEVDLLKKRLRQVLSRQKGMSKLVGRTQGRAAKVSAREKDYLRLMRNVEESRKVYMLVSRRFKEVEIASQIQNNNVSVLDKARAAFLVRPKVLFNVVFAVGGGVLAGLAVVFLLNLFDSTVKSQEDIEHVLGLTFLGVVPTVRREPGEEAGPPELYVYTHPTSTVAEMCRTVRTNIQFMSPDKTLKRLLVTSAAPLEGKTMVTISLGISMAQTGSKVLLISSDMRRPRANAALGIQSAKGISNVIVGEAEIEDVILHTDVPNLHVLPCGPIPPNPAEILQSDRFGKMIAAVEGRYDRVLFDSPPVSAVSDPLILGARSEGVILVVRASVTTKEMIRQARRKLDAVNAPILGCVLNHLDLRKGSYGYYHSYYYASEKAPNTRGTG